MLRFLKEILKNMASEKKRKSENTVKASGFIGLSSLCFIISLLVLLVAAFIYWPAPDLTEEVKAWKAKGHVYSYQSFDIFYYHGKNPTANTKSSVIILHSFPASSYVWKELVDELQLIFANVIIPDLIGLGFSDKPLNFNYTVAEQANLVTSLSQSLGIHKVHVIGHDYGGTIAQELLSRYNTYIQDSLTIESICMLNGGIIPSTHQPLFVQRLFWNPNFFIKFIVRHAVSWVLFKSRFPVLYGPNTQPSMENLTDIYSILMYKSGHYVLPDVINFFHERHLHEKRWTGALQHTKVDIALIYGTLDKVNTPENFLKRYQKEVTNSKIYLLDNAGHYPHMEDREGFLVYYKEFLNSIKKDNME